MEIQASNLQNKQIGDPLKQCTDFNQFARYPASQLESPIIKLQYLQQNFEYQQRKQQDILISHNNQEEEEYQPTDKRNLINLPVIRSVSNNNANISVDKNKRNNYPFMNKIKNLEILRSKRKNYPVINSINSINTSNISQNQSPVINYKNIHLQQIRSQHKLTNPYNKSVSQAKIHEPIKNYKQIHMETLKKIKQQRNNLLGSLKQNNTNDHKNQKYKNIKPRLMEHTEKALPSLYQNNKTTTYFSELESADVLENYKIISHVGKGCFSVVSSAINKKTMNKYAIKTYTKVDQMEKHRLEGIQSEVQNLLNLNHQNIINLKHAIKDGKKIQLVMQNGGQQSLSGVLRKTKIFSEQLTKKYFRQIAQALAYCHEKSICHRDLKLENILVDDLGKVKVIDFGFSTKCGKADRLKSFCGTPPYMSPQLASKTPYNGPSADVWAMGVAVYLMLVGKFPFRANNQKQLYRLIQQGKYKIIDSMSKQVKDLLSSMLKVNEKQRITANQILDSQWLKQESEANIF